MGNFKDNLPSRLGLRVDRAIERLGLSGPEDLRNMLSSPEGREAFMSMPNTGKKTMLAAMRFFDLKVGAEYEKPKTVMVLGYRVTTDFRDKLREMARQNKVS